MDRRFSNVQSLRDLLCVTIGISVGIVHTVVIHRNLFYRGHQKKKKKKFHCKLQGQLDKGISGCIFFMCNASDVVSFRLRLRLNNWHIGRSLHIRVVDGIPKRQCRTVHCYN